MRENNKIDKDKVDAPSNRRNQKGKNYQRRNNSRPASDKSGDKTYWFESKTNDIAWYSKNPVVLENACKIPFNAALGLSIDYGSGTFVLSPSSVMMLDLYPMLGALNGTNTDAEASINVAARKLAAKLRKGKSGYTPYDAPDVIIEQMAAASCYAFLAEMRRVYGLLELAAAKNKTWPIGLFRLMGYNYQDLSEHAADLLKFINIYATKLATINVLDSLSVAKRWFWLEDHLFIDKPTPKAQTYLFRFKYYYVYSATALPTGGCLIPTIYNASTFANIVSFGNSLLAPLINDGDVTMINGDIETAKTAGVQGFLLMQAPLTERDYKVIPICDYHSLLQIHNAVSVGGTVATTSVYTLIDRYIQQDQSLTTYGPFIKSKVAFYHSGLINSTQYTFGGKTLIDIPSDPAEMQEIVESTRLTATVDGAVKDSGGLSLVTVKGCMTEVVMNITGLRSNLSNPTSFSTFYIEDFDVPSITLSNLNNIMSFKSNFDFAPLVSVYDDYGGDAVIYGDLMNYTVVDDVTLNGLHDACIISMFDLTEPQLNK